MRRVEAHQLGDLAVVGDRAERRGRARVGRTAIAGRRWPRAPARRSQRQHADRQAARQRDALRCSARRSRSSAGRPRTARAAAFWITIDEAEGHDQRRQRIAPERAVEHAALQRVADAERDRQQQQQRRPAARAAARARRDAPAGDRARTRASTMKSPCAVLVSRITPNISDWPSANSAYRPPSSRPWTTMSTATRIAPRSDAEVRLRDLLAGQRRPSAFAARRALPGSSRRAATRAARSRRPARRSTTRHAFGADRRQRVVDLAGSRSARGRALSSSHSSTLRVAHQRAADRDHLLLAARQRASPGCVRLLREDREQPVQRAQVPRPGALARTRPSAGSPRPTGSGTGAGLRARARCRAARSRPAAARRSARPSKRDLRRARALHQARSAPSGRCSCPRRWRR